MATVIDLSAKLTNERPILRIAEGMEYVIDDRKNTVLKISKTLQENNKDDSQNMDEAIKLALGAKAFKDIEALNLPFMAYRKIITAIMAAVTEEDYEAAEARFRTEK